MSDRKKDEPQNTVSMISSEDTIDRQVNDALDQSIESLSPEVRRKLNQARIAALEKKSRFIPIWKLASGVGFVFALLLFSQFISLPVEENLTPFAEVLEEDMEMLEELEFVYWMTEEESSVTQ